MHLTLLLYDVSKTIITKTKATLAMNGGNILSTHNSICNELHLE